MRTKVLPDKILYKVLLLVLIPFVLESMFFIQLYGLVQSADRIAQQESRQVEIVQRINDLVLLVANSFGSIASYLFTGSSKYAYSITTFTQQVSDRLDGLEQLAHDDPILITDIGRMRNVLHATQGELQKLVPSQTGDNVQYIQEMRWLPKAANQNLVVAQDLLRTSKLKLDDVRRTELARRDSVNTQIIVGLIGNFFLALALIFLFTNGLTNRLAKLVANARRLPGGEPLPHMVSGTDEIAFLDKVLHDASDQLISAAEFRKSLMQMVAHDLRSPLMSCQVALEIMVSEHFQDDLSARARAKLMTMKTSMMKLMGLVEDLLMIEKLESGKLDLKREQVQISALVDDVFETLSDLARSHQIKLTNDCSADFVSADKTRLLQIITNYLSNAIKFSPDQSEIRVYTVIGDKMRICVEDQGRGLEADERKRLFQKFQQGRGTDQSRGFGLGLSICKLLAESHGGTVGVESEFGKGSTFWFELPMGAVGGTQP